MTADVVGVLAEALAQHQWRGSFLGCRCGWNWSESLSHGCGEDERIARAHREHVASVVAALPNIAVVILPEPDTNDRIQHWKVGDISAAERSGLVWADLEPTVYGHEDARVVAANLLAAARAAEGQA